MSQENSWFNPPPDDAVLWRYMDFELTPIL